MLKHNYKVNTDKLEYQICDSLEFHFISLVILTKCIIFSEINRL